MRARPVAVPGVSVLLAWATRAAALTLPAGFEATVVAGDLAQPTAAAYAPDGRLFVLEKRGAVRLSTASAGLLAAPVLALPSCNDSEMGLLGLAFDPQFMSNGYLYLYHTHPPGGDLANCNTSAGRFNRIVRVTVIGDAVDPASLLVLFDGIRTDNGNHDGGGLVIGADGFLYAGVGDAGTGDGGPPGASTNPYAQDVTSPNGKILRLQLDGAPAPGNPFAGQGGASDYVFARGLRNPFRLAIQPATGLLWTGDVGQNTWEEIDVVRAGDNLGWPQCEGFEPRPPCPGGTVPPVHVYAHGPDGASVTGGIFYTATHLPPGFRGSYFFGDFVLDLIWRAIPSDLTDGFVVAPEVFARDAEAPVDFTLSPTGALCYVAFTAGEVRCIGQPPPSPEACGRELAAAAPAFLRASARATATCARRGRPACFPPPPQRLRRATARLGRAIRRPCASPPAELCARLGCVPCADARALAQCAAATLAAVTGDLAADTLGNDRSACARTAFRAGARFAATRARAIARCLRRAEGACVPGPDDAGRLARRLRRRCAVPPAELCLRLGCAACATSAEVAACLARTVGGAVDAAVERLS